MTNPTKTLTVLATLALATSLHAAPEAHQIDTDHSGITFKIRHLITTVPGSVPGFEGSVTFHPDHLDQAAAEVSVKVASINTNNDRRDDHLRNEDFFEVETFPGAHFRSTRFEAVEGENRYHIVGDLTIRDVTREITLDATFLGFAEGRQGQSVQGWEATTTIDRRDFGITYGQGLIGNEVTLELFVQAHGN